MKFSFIIATINRSDMLKRCIDSILLQPKDSYEIIVIDQSEGNITEKLIGDCRIVNKCIKYLKLSIKGLSHARNEGIKNSVGEYLCFIDDDAELPSNFIEKLNNTINRYPNVIGFIGKIVDKSSGIAYLDSMNIGYDKIIDFNNHNKIASSSMIIKRDIVVQVGMYDESFGVGSVFGSCEENDLISRILYINNNIYFIHDLIVYHPVDQSFSIDNVRNYKYSLGFGALCKKHLSRYRNWFYLYTYLNETIKALLHMIVHFMLLNKSKGIKCFYTVKGYLDGFLNYK